MHLHDEPPTHDSAALWEALHAVLFKVTDRVSIVQTHLNAARLVR